MLFDQVIWVGRDDRVRGIITRGQAHHQGLLHRIAITYVRDRQGQILIQRRLSGRLDHSSAGHVDPGESYLMAARRELAEELGFKARKLTKIGQVISLEAKTKSYHLAQIFSVTVSSSKRFYANPREVNGFFWANPDKVRRDMHYDLVHKKYTKGFKDSLRIFLKNQ